MIVPLSYGRGFLNVDFPDALTTVISPAEGKPLPEEKLALQQALAHPIGCAPLLQQIRPADKIAILFTDSTRATPNERIIPWLLETLAGHPRENIVLINQLGTHRPNTREQLEEMLTPEVVRNYRVLNHDCEDLSELVKVGTMHDGTPALINKTVMDADFRIVTGFIEPHFFAGFSGGPKGIIPGCAGLVTVQASHDVGNIGHPNSVFGILQGNPLWEELMGIAEKITPSFLVNVTLDSHKAITGIYAGDLREAHRLGCAAVKEAAMQPVSEPFDIVVTTNSGYPLDQNLYQGVKGMSAASRIVRDGGTIILACECSAGIPADSPFETLVNESDSPAALLTRLATPGFRRPEQWQAQIQALVQCRAEVMIYSALENAAVRAMHLTPCADISTTVRELVARIGPGARVAVLPHGPLTIPYLAA